MSHNKAILIWLSMATTVLFISGFTRSLSSKDVPAGKNLVWSDEFDYAGLPDAKKWSYDLGNGCPSNCGWGNNELQFYTDKDSRNARVENGHLIIEAHKTDESKKPFTSARLLSKNQGDWKYGYIEVRAKLPAGKGLWPAAWMLPTDWAYGNWPASGEIDIMEFVGYLPDTIYGTVHTESYNTLKGNQINKGIYVNDLSSEFHTYGIDWTEHEITFLFDKKPYLTFKNEHKTYSEWPFDQKFHILLNMAVGGNWGGKMGIDHSIFPQKYFIDYVRVYQH
ncbi:MAG: glycoside hydrolase family 16 protein [Saprospiraceae bacterium]|nr:glycoside hydrolase family 16 protein [Saprospiraceae bacterium]